MVFSVSVLCTLKKWDLELVAESRIPQNKPRLAEMCAVPRPPRAEAS